MFDIKNPNSFLGGQNVHNLIIIGLLIFIIFKLMKKVNNEESGLVQSLAGSKPSSRGGVSSVSNNRLIPKGAPINGLCPSGQKRCAVSNNPTSPNFGLWGESSTGNTCCEETL